MAAFDNFQSDELDIIVSLPYRVGAWMAAVDNDRATRRDEKREEKALIAVLESLAGQERSNPFVAAVAAQAMTRRERWVVWRARKGLSEDITAACATIGGVMAAEAVIQYKKALFHIACTVAQAHGEHHHVEAMLGEIMARLSDRFFDPLEKNPENISPVEKAALQKLKEALKG